MIGYDRPLRPRWIYESLIIAQPGQRLSDLNKPFESIARELTGKEGKRKARTVLFRCFIRDEQNQTRVKKGNCLKDLTIQYEYEFMIPLYLFYLIGKTEPLIKISEHIFRLYSFGSEVNVKFLKEKMIDSLGDRDVVTRSVRAFIKTLEAFSIVVNEGSKLILKERLSINEEQARIMFQLFAGEIINSPQILLNHIPHTLFNYFHLPNIKMLAQKYNGRYWDYQQRVKDDLLVMYTVR
ncbi:hypothetical protein ACFLXJ_00590 [Chloroflexota bacterium]